MNALILAAGYATRMYQLTRNKAKPLLPIAGRPMIDYLVEKIDEVEEVDRIYVVVNDRFLEDFQVWVAHPATSKPVVLVNDGSTCDENKLGAIGDMNFAVEKEGIQDDLLVVGGDNLFDFGLREFVSFFAENGTSVALHISDDPEDVRKFSTVELDKAGRIVYFEEKAKKARSNLVAICLYLFERASLPLLKQYLEEGRNPDEPGRYMQWLHKQIPVYGKILKGSWYDIGNAKTYWEADRLFRERAQRPENRGAGSLV